MECDSVYWTAGSMAKAMAHAKASSSVAVMYSASTKEKRKDRSSVVAIYWASPMAIGRASCWAEGTY